MYELQDHSSQGYPLSNSHEGTLEDREPPSTEGGDRKALAQQLGSLRRQLIRFFRMKGRRDAEELAQETLLAYMHAIPRFEGRSSVWTYVRVIANRRLWAIRRAEMRRMPSPAVEDIDPGELEAALDVRRASDILDRLRPRDRAILWLYFCEGHRAPEIARSLGVPLGTVRTRIRRALERARAQVSAAQDLDSSCSAAG